MYACGGEHSFDAYWSVHKGQGTNGKVVASGIADKHCKLTRQHIDTCNTAVVPRTQKKQIKTTTTVNKHTWAPQAQGCMDYVISMSDSFGDGWQGTHLHVGNRLSFTMVPELDDSLYTYFTDSLSYREKVACLKCTSQPLEVFACGGHNHEEASWEIKQVTVRVCVYYVWCPSLWCLFYYSFTLSPSSSLLSLLHRTVSWWCRESHRRSAKTLTKFTSLRAKLMLCKKKKTMAV